LKTIPDKPCLMCILHLHEKTTIHGGAEVYISQLQDLLPLFNYETYWIGIDKSSGEYTITEFGKETVTKCGDIKSVFQFIKDYIKEKNIDLINIHNIFNPAIVRFCLQTLPVVKSVHSPVMVCPGKDKFWRYSERPCTIPYGLHCFKHIYTEGCANRHPKRVIRAWNYVNFEVHEAAAKYQRIVVMSNYIKKGMLESGIAESQIVCNPYFTNEIIPVPDIKLGSGVKTILFIGRLISSKGPHIMLQSLLPLLNEKDDLQLQIIGDGIMKTQLMSTVKEMHLEHKVSFSGWMAKPDIDRAIGQSALVMFPSIYPEAFGIVGIEAMMQGKPVVGFDVGGVSTWLKDGITGFLVQRSDINSMREKTALLLSDAALYETMSSNARKQALEHYVPDIHIKRLIGVYSNSKLSNA